MDYKPGTCPICGMDLVPINPSDYEDQKTYKDLAKKCYSRTMSGVNKSTNYSV